MGEGAWTGVGRPGGDAGEGERAGGETAVNRGSEVTPWAQTVHDRP